MMLRGPEFDIMTFCGIGRGTRYSAPISSREGEGILTGLSPSSCPSWLCNSGKVGMGAHPSSQLSLVSGSGVALGTPGRQQAGQLSDTMTKLGLDLIAGSQRPATERRVLLG